MFLLSCGYMCSVLLPRSAVGWSEVVIVVFPSHTCLFYQFNNIGCAINLIKHTHVYGNIRKHMIVSVHYIGRYGANDVMSF